jgi:hypothetical protein
MDFIEVCPPKMGRTKMSEGKPYVYKEVPGQVCGEYRLIKYVHPIGHYVSYILVL